jgi:tRNA threonylcarbamoyladenosine biosynthesis protein TsaE
MVTSISRSPEETIALGEQWGQTAEAGWVIGLVGELGAGKTQLVKGLALGLGIMTGVHSPTFTLVHAHARGRLLLAHLDLYRLETREAILRAGLEEYFYQPVGVVVVEWMERWLGEGPRAKGQRPDLPRRYRHVMIEHLSERERRISYEDFGP